MSTPSPETEPSVVPRRERARAATIEEIKATALELMRRQRTTDVTFTDIAKHMGMTPPALYRYFDGRDDLLTVLITDAYDELGGLVRDAVAVVPADDHWGALVAAGTTYRTWAAQAPERFTLILGMPVPGYVADEEGPTTAAAEGAMSQLAALFVQARQAGRLGEPLVRDVDPALREHQDQDKGVHAMDDLSPESFQSLLHAWTALHGFTSLEAYGHLEWLGPEGKDALFAGQLRLIAAFTGLPGASEPPATPAT